MNAPEHDAPSVVMPILFSASSRRSVIVGLNGLLYGPSCGMFATAGGVEAQAAT